MWSSMSAEYSIVGIYSSIAIHSIVWHFEAFLAMYCSTRFALSFLAFIDPNNFGLVKVKELIEGQFFEIK